MLLGFQVNIDIVTMVQVNMDIVTWFQVNMDIFTGLQVTMDIVNRLQVNIFSPQLYVPLDKSKIIVGSLLFKIPLLILQVIIVPNF